MVRRIKRKPKRPAQGQRPRPAWTVPFGADGRPALWIHKHGDTDDHSGCGPVVMCCERALKPYRQLAPDLCTGIEDVRAQSADHLGTWIDGGLQAMYFVLCDPEDEAAVYQFGLPADQARELLSGRVSHERYRRPEYRFQTGD